MKLFLDRVNEGAPVPSARRQTIREARWSAKRARYQCGAISRSYARQLCDEYHGKYVPVRWYPLFRSVFVDEAVRRPR